MKTSIYNFIINKNGRKVIFNSFTSSIISITNSEYENIFKNILFYPNSVIAIYPTLVKKFMYLGFIIDDKEDEVDKYFLKQKDVIYDEENIHFTINPTLECNFDCWYCSVKSYVKNDTILEGHMNKQIADSIIVYFTKLINNGVVKHLKIDWFGGEPLMYYDEIIKYISTAIKLVADKKGVDFLGFITTNGYLFTKRIVVEMQELNINGFQITLDGEENRHNVIRNSNGTKSYTTILNNIKTIIKHNINSTVILRINYDKKTILKLEDILKDLSNINKQQLQIDFQKVWQVKFDENDKVILDEKMSLFKLAGFKILTAESRPNQFISCYANKTKYRVINYNGDLFKCTARDYSDNIKIGQIKNNGIIDNVSILQKYEEYNVSNLYKCRKCKILPLCNGPCIQKYFEYMNNESVKFDDICLLSNYNNDINIYINEHLKYL